MEKDLTINKEQRLYNIHFDGGMSCLGFDVVERRAKAMAHEMNIVAPVMGNGTEGLYREYQELVTCAKNRMERTGLRLNCEKHPALTNLEGERVSCDINGERETFFVGKSTGWMPCHLMILRRGDDGGSAISPDDKITNLVKLGEYVW